MEHLSIIQGDTLDTVLTIDNPSDLEISSVKFVCQSLGINEEFIPANEEDIKDTYSLCIDNSTTQKLYVGNWNFDVIAQLSSGEVYTVIRGVLEVIHRKEYDKG